MTAAVKPLPPHGTANPTGTRRRLQALHHDGYDTRRIGNAIGRRSTVVAKWMRNNYGIGMREAGAVADLYQRWAGIPAELNGSSPAAAAVARTMARRRRWHPAIAWAGEDIDDPATMPTRWHSMWRSEELAAEAQELRAQTDDSWPKIAAQIGVSLNTLEKARERTAARARAKAGAA